MIKKRLLNKNVKYTAASVAILAYFKVTARYVYYIHISIYMSIPLVRYDSVVYET